VLAAAVRHHEAGRLEEAAALYRQVLDREPANPDALHLLGVITHQRGNPAAGEDLIRRAIALRPNAARFHNNLGKLLAEQARWAEAAAAQRRAVELDPNYLGAYSGLGVALAKLGDLAAAEAAYRQALVRAPTDPGVQQAMGLFLQDSGRLEEAEGYLQAVVDRHPDSIATLMALGSVQMGLMKLDRAAAHFNRIVRLRPDAARARWNRGVISFLKGDFAAGGEDFEHRVAAGVAPERAFGMPRWTGEPLNGRTIFVHAEQGMGTAIQLARYVPIIAERGGRVILETYTPLERLFQSLAGAAAVVPVGAPTPEADVNAPLFSMPHIFKTRRDNVPAPIPYLSVADALRRQWQAVIADAKGLRVGLAWAGNPAHTNDRNRSMTLSLLAPLFALPDVSFFSLQVGQRSDEVSAFAPHVVDLSGRLSDFADTAAVIEALDLVIAVDTAVVHLAGALGRPAWVLLPFAPDWRWMIDREDTPWYPTLRLFRQPRRGDWQTVIARVRGQLAALAAERRP
jgi:Tfp pilus assembly protein PilF